MRQDGVGNYIVLNNTQYLHKETGLFVYNNNNNNKYPLPRNQIFTASYSSWVSYATKTPPRDLHSASGCGRVVSCFSVTK